MRAFAWAVTAAALVASSAPSLAQSNNQVGTLVCNYGANVGMIFGSRQTMACVFHKRNGDTEAYKATFGRLGVDIGVTGPGRMSWIVLTGTKGPAPRALAGTYLGATGEASFGLGGGANVLVGGSKRTITLQPLSVDVQTGLNVAAGAAKLTLL
jgi:hypothetical protein